MKKSSKERIRKIIKYPILIVLTLLFLLNVSVRVTLFDSYGCISVAFDKWDVMNADKAILCIEDKQYTITDRDLIQMIAEETVVATYTDVKYSKQPERWIELYTNDRLVRRMRWTYCCDEALVYEGDASHWVLFSREKEGFAALSEELLEQLYAVIEE